MSAARGSKPHFVDVHVGRQLRAQRVFCGLTQEELAEQLGITYEQMQKHENGNVRLSASSLLLASKILAAPVSYFFEGVNERVEAAADVVSTRTWLDFIRRLETCPDEICKNMYRSGQALTDILGAPADEEPD